MKHVHDLLRSRLLAQAGVHDHTPVRKTKDELRAQAQQWEEHQWSTEFEKLMRNRMVMGFMRYGSSRKPRAFGVNVKDILKRINIYLATGNTEGLVDAANLCMCEFLTSQHPQAHFTGTDRLN